MEKMEQESLAIYPTWPISGKYNWAIYNLSSLFW